MTQMRSIVFVIAVSMICTGCFCYMGSRTPNLIKLWQMPTPEIAPKIDIDFRHQILANGQPVGGPPTRVSNQNAREAFERVRAQTPFLRNAKPDLADADFRLSIESHYESHETTWPVVIYVWTGSVFPYISTMDVSLTATLSRAGGETLKTYVASCEIERLISVLTLAALPVSAGLYVFSPNPVDETYRDLFIQIAEDLPGFVDSARTSHI